MSRECSDAVKVLWAFDRIRLHWSRPGSLHRASASEHTARQFENPHWVDSGRIAEVGGKQNGCFRAAVDLKQTLILLPCGSLVSVLEDEFGPRQRPLNRGAVEIDELDAEPDEVVRLGGRSDDASGLVPDVHKPLHDWATKSAARTRDNELHASPPSLFASAARIIRQAGPAARPLSLTR